MLTLRLGFNIESHSITESYHYLMINSLFKVS